MLMSTIIVII